MKKIKILKIKNNKKEPVQDLVTEEISLTITISRKEITTLLCSPDNINDLVTGYLFSSGIIDDISEIRKISLDKKKWIASVVLKNNDIITDLVFKKLQPPGCGKGMMLYNLSGNKNLKKISTDLKIKAGTILKFMIELRKMSKTYIKTGGTHSAVIADRENIIVFREDIGRHNAVDKVIGSRLLNHDSLQDKILITSGRISSEIFLKAYRCGIPFIVSKSAPTDEAVKQCGKAGITLVGFARGTRMNIYSGEERIQ